MLYGTMNGVQLDPMISPMVLLTLMTLYENPFSYDSHSGITKDGKKIVEKQVFGGFKLHNLLFYPLDYFLDQ